MESGTAFEDALSRVVWALRRAELAVQAAKEPGLRAVGVPAAHYALLVHVHLFPGLSGAELARRLGVTTQAVALLATKLEARGLLERRVHPRHRNVQELHLTDAGSEALQEADTAVLEVERRVREKLGPERHAVLRELLDEVTDELGGPSARQWTGRGQG
ncbi:MarR family winged helix-turn-helix transcriptional regulator [Umezawaea tangerina]|uniref:DNA-binding MarR family transcriptional regulator n=1 Tax=Umezawaea tangerina TaxID=84725 RepID=A0A2T0SP70_9PSEU|nr:MarR family transcriptional regulator [Umezawaea tangerina]PRY35186.1 DNA-binding MarR family transcriptional regulator [Umezawaea tangerina]